MSALAGAVMPRFFSARSLAPESAAAASARTTLLATNPTGYAGCCAAIRDMDHIKLLARIRVPTLVISGDHDVSTPWSGHGEVLANAIAGARSVLLPAAHLSNLERPSAFTAALLDFLLPAASDPLAAGFTIRRQMLGDAHVDRAVANTTGFTYDFQAITAALGRSEEFRLHVHTGLANELETVDLEEVLMQVAIYAGVPAANSAFRIASDEGAR
jgi:3-oxoadipate enol-lactonase/4-carboxymuconolactone decarboxylase